MTTPGWILDDERAGTCAGFFARALDYFAAHGITDIERLMTDNAFSYRHGRELCEDTRMRSSHVNRTSCLPAVGG